MNRSIFAFRHLTRCRNAVRISPLRPLTTASNRSDASPKTRNPGQQSFFGPKRLQCRSYSTMVSYHSTVEAQRKYFKTGATIPLEGRKAVLKKIKEITIKHGNDIADAVHKDLKRDREYTKAFDVAAVIGECDYFLANLDEWAKPIPVSTAGSPVDPDAEAFIVKDPQGVVLLISPWNYPVFLCFWPLVPIIAAGNTCIIKPSELAPACSELITKMVKENFDPNLITVVEGGVPETTALLEERYDHIMYTGAPHVAKIIMAAAAKNLTPVTLELGGKSPVIVEPDADIQKTAERLVANKWVNVGQTCITPDYVLTRDELKPKLAAAIEAELTKKYGDKPKDSPLYSRIINERHFDRLVSTLEKSEGKVLHKHGDDHHDRDDKFIAPHVLDVHDKDAFMQDEIFGPFLPLLSVNSFDEAIDFINNGEKPLASYIFTKDEGKIAKFLSHTTAGGVTINDVQKHASVKGLPFGGVGNSGMGRYNGKYGFDTFTHEKAVYKRPL
uniref:Aldehyde dehydrogenase n=1 Tax=Panagrellus redivivus TaxID=6233 RepID=A0A7E4V4I3_PANRE